MDTPLGSVLYITLGCAKNEVDTDRMRSLLTAAGYEEAFDPQDADIAIVNTCSFLASATSESIETTLELANEVQDGVRSCPIVMCGCVPSRYGDDLPDELPEVAAFVKADEEDGIVAVIDGVLGVEREIAAYIPQVKRTIEGAVAYVKISDGCNRLQLLHDPLYSRSLSFAQCREHYLRGTRPGCRRCARDRADRSGHGYLGHRLY